MSNTAGGTSGQDRSRGRGPGEPHQAAIFDLDRTLLTGASTPYIRKALAAVGLATERGLPGEGIFLRIYDTLGESLPHMALARLAAFASAGWPVEAAKKAGELAAELLAPQVAPFAGVIIDEHRSAGRLLVLATTTPHHLIAPFARALGFDEVVATRYASRDGSFTGRLDGSFVWSGWKLAAVRKWAAEAGVDLAASFAYSDSVYDAPLLQVVGHPFAVNPDPRLRALALARRWPVLHLDVPQGVPKVAGIEPFDVAVKLVRPQMMPFARFDIRGAERIPKRGPVIVASNHRSYFDVAAVGFLAAATGRPLRFLAKKELTDAPVVGYLARAMGAIRVDRGSGTDESLSQAIRALKGGDAVGIFPQGTIPRGREFFEPVLAGKTGVARLARASGAPVVPVAIWGTENVWPRSAHFPRVTQVWKPPRVNVRVGEPIPAEALPRDAAEATRVVMEAIMALLPEELNGKREPTAEEIRAAMPPGRRE